MPCGAWDSSFLTWWLQGEAEKSKTPCSSTGRYFWLCLTYLWFIGHGSRAESGALGATAAFIFADPPLLTRYFLRLSTGCQRVWWETPTHPYCQITAPFHLLCRGMAFPVSALSPGRGFSCTHSLPLGFPKPEKTKKKKNPETLTAEGGCKKESAGKIRVNH